MRCPFCDATVRRPLTTPFRRMLLFLVFIAATSVALAHLAAALR